MVTHLVADGHMPRVKSTPSSGKPAKAGTKRKGSEAAAADGMEPSVRMRMLMTLKHPIPPTELPTPPRKPRKPAAPTLSGRGGGADVDAPSMETVTQDALGTTKFWKSVLKAHAKGGVQAMVTVVSGDASATALKEPGKGARWSLVSVRGLPAPEIAALRAPTEHSAASEARVVDAFKAVCAKAPSAVAHVTCLVMTDGEMKPVARYRKRGVAAKD